MKTCPMCDSDEIRKEPAVSYNESDIKGVRETCMNPECRYTQFLSDKGDL